MQIFGFHLDDPPQANGATALRPSLSVTCALFQKGITAYSFRVWVGRELSSGTLRRASSPTKFWMVLNGKRVELDATLATGQMALGIEGHTDNIGSDRYNDDLSARRAAAVKTALVRDCGIDAAWLSAGGFGQRRPIESNKTLSDRARNRCVELVCAQSQ